MLRKSCVALATPNPTRVHKVHLIISTFPHALNTLGLLENISICKNPPFEKLLAPKRCRRSVQARTSLINRANSCPAIERECLQPHRMRGLCTNGELHPVFFVFFVVAVVCYMRPAYLKAGDMLFQILSGWSEHSRQCFTTNLDVSRTHPAQASPLLSVVQTVGTCLRIHVTCPLPPNVIRLIRISANDLFANLRLDLGCRNLCQRV